MNETEVNVACYQPLLNQKLALSSTKEDYFNITNVKTRRKYDLNFVTSGSNIKNISNKDNFINISKLNDKSKLKHVYSNTQSHSLSNNYRIRGQKNNHTKYPVSQSPEEVFYSQKSIYMKKSLQNQGIKTNQKQQKMNQPSYTMKIIDNHERMKFKFERLYEKIERISMKEEIGVKQRQNVITNTSLVQPYSYKKKMHNFQQVVKTTATEMFKFRVNSIQHKKISQTIQKELKSLQIHNANAVNQVMNQPEHIDVQAGSLNYQGNRYFNGGSNISIQASLMRGRLKRKNLQPLKKVKMSNNIRDYLSVQKIQIKQIQDSIIQKHTELNRKIQQRKSQLLNLSTYKHIQIQRESQNSSSNLLKHKNIQKTKTYSSAMGSLIRPAKFKAPFQLYSYRDFLWKIGYSNNYLVQFPQQYETKIKFFVGKGNNSNLIKGIIKRRSWYQITDKYQEANFVWTQIKFQNYFNIQKSIQKQQHLLNYQEYQDKNYKTKNTKISPFSVLNQLQTEKFNNYWKIHVEKQKKMKENMKIRTKVMKAKQNKVVNAILDVKIHNHFRNNFMIGNKKALFHTMSQYYSSISQSVFDTLPLTFHVKNGLQDDQYLKFLQNFYSIAKQIKRLSNPQNSQSQASIQKYIYKHNAWIVKPGQNTNRGNGIIVCLSLEQIKSILKKKQKHDDGTYKTYIIQKYIEKPLLYKRRKFDLRHYMLMTCSNGIKKGYWYKEGYVRTTSSEYTLKFSSGAVHLTNDAVQKNLPDYGKFQKGNKLSYEELNTYIHKNDKDFDFWKIVYPKMKKIATDSMRASALLMDPDRKVNNFQVFGMDFMIDQDYNVWLIQINANPCLQLSCPLLGKIIPRMIENTFKICLDPIFTPPVNFSPKNMQHFQNVGDQNYYQLVYDQRIDSVPIQMVDLSKNDQKFQEDDDVYEDDGDAWDQD